MTPKPIQPIPDLRVLLVEDNPHDRAALRRALSDSHPVITECANAEEALRQAGSLSDYDILLVDHSLPGTSGLKLCRELVGRGDCPPITVLTGSGSELLAADFLRLGVSDYLVKDLEQKYLQLLPTVVFRSVRQHREQTQRRLFERHLAEAGVRRKALMDSLPVGVYSVDRDFKLTEMNRTAELLTGYSAEEALGQPCREVFRGSHCGPHCPLRQAIEKQEALGPLEFELFNIKEQTIPLSYTANGIFDVEGRLLGGVAVFQDVTMLKTLEKGRASMLSMLAHDMKTPLVSIKGFSRLLQEKDEQLDPEKRQTYLNVVHKESEQLHQLILDFLESAQQGFSGLHLNFSTVDLGQLLAEVASHYAVRAEQLEVDLKTEIPDAAAWAQVDSDRLLRALRNLVDNALNHSPPRGIVTLRLKKGSQKHTLEVSDQGRGIEPEDLPQLFKPFYRGKHSQNQPGYGLGLTGVKAIIQAHAGTVEVFNNQESGCTFQISLPASSCGVR